MARSTYVLALLVSLVALMGLAPTASAANDSGRRVDPNPRINWGVYHPSSQVRPNPRIHWRRTAN